MKVHYLKLVLFIFINTPIACFLPVLVSQSEWAPIGAEWYYGFQEEDANCKGYDHIVVEKDTVFLGQTCRLLAVERVNAMGQSAFGKYFTYEQNDSIFFAQEVDDHFRLVMDFGMDVGDTIYLERLEEGYGPDTAIASLELIQDVVIDGIEFKKYTLKQLNNPGGNLFCGLYTEYFERIGHWYDFVTQANCEIIIDDYDQKFRCYKDENIDVQIEDCDFYGKVNAVIENSNVSPKIFPNPASSVLNIKIENNAEYSIHIYDGMGTIIKRYSSVNYSLQINTADWEKGIYIVSLQCKQEIINTRLLIL